MTSNLGLDFIDRTIRTTGAVLLVVFLFGLYYLGFYTTLAIFSGGVWAIVNLIFLAAFIRTAIRPGEIDKLAVAGLALIKFPALYVAGYFLLTAGVFEPLHVVIGFSILIGVIVLKVIARALLGLDRSASERNELQEVL